MTRSNDTTDLNDNLVRIDNLLRAVEYLYEELSTRRTDIMEQLSPEKIGELTLDRMNSAEFRELLVTKIRENMGDTLYREVCMLVMGNIDDDIDAFITDRVHTALRNAGVSVPETIAEDS